MKTAYIHCDIDKHTEDAILVEEDRIVKVGTSDEIEALITEQDEVVDFHGMSVYPGFVDSHCHLVELGYYLDNLMLSGCSSISAVLSLIEKKKAIVQDGEWIIGRGFHEEQFVEKRMIEKKDLDEITTEVPIALTRACGHKMVVNSKVLEIMNIEEDTELEGGQIDYELGFVEETGIHYVQSFIPEPNEKQLKKYIQMGCECMNSYGVTTVGSDDFVSVTKDYKNVLNVFEQMSYQDSLNVRIQEQCEFHDVKEFAGFLDDGYTFDVGNDNFRIGPLKLILDGSLGAKTAALRDGYLDDKKNKGIFCMSDEDIEMYVALANRFNMPTIAHAIGDAALEKILKIFDEQVLEGNPLHHGVVHCQIMSKKQKNRILEKQLVAYFQSLFIDHDANLLKERVKEDLVRTSYPYRSLMEGTLACNGSDAPVEMPNVLKGMQLAMTRTSTLDGTSMNQDECLSMDQAFDSYTINGAQAMFMEDRIGKIEEGYYADFVVLDKNIRECNPEEISAIKVRMTVKGGKVVYER